MSEYVDVLIVGAGLSGIGAAYHLTQKCPTKTFAILEGREAIGGTWDLFRYPGIRSDSDMHTLGYVFKPWTEAKAIADGPSIRKYIRDTAEENGFAKHIRFGHKVVAAAWNSAAAQWSVTAERVDTGEQVTLRCNFLHLCAGYYDYDEGYTPEFEGADTFEGQVVHPQFWTDDIDYAGKNVVIIGSGATAVTLVPEMAKTAGHVTMLQRSPTYIVSRPAEDAFANRLRSILPDRLAYAITRWRTVLLQMYFYKLVRAYPERAKERLINLVREELGPGHDIETDYTPSYNPWDQRICLVPDSDMFQALKEGSASVTTDHIDRFVPEGILLKSGKTLAADLIVTATGLKLKALGGVSIHVNGQPMNIADTLNYKGMMYSDVPNLASVFGYVNASWTLKADLVSDYLCRLLNHMDKTGHPIATPRQTDPKMQTEPWISFSSGYIERARHLFPQQGRRKPWKLNQNYALDLMALRHGRIDDGVMEFAMPGRVVEEAPQPALAAE